MDAVRRPHPRPNTAVHTPGPETAAPAAAVGTKPAMWRRVCVAVALLAAHAAAFGGVAAAEDVHTVRTVHSAHSAAAGTDTALLEEVRTRKHTHTPFLRGPPLTAPFRALV